MTKVMTGIDGPNRATTSSSIISRGSDSLGLQQAADDGVDPAATVAGQRAENQADQPGHQHGQHTDHQGHLAAVEHARPAGHDRVGRCRRGGHRSTGEGAASARLVASGRGQRQHAGQRHGAMTISTAMVPTQILTRLSRRRWAAPARAMSRSVTAEGRGFAGGSTTWVVGHAQWLPRLSESDPGVQQWITEVDEQLHQDAQALR